MTRCVELMATQVARCPSHLFADHRHRVARARRLSGTLDPQRSPVEELEEEGRNLEIGAAQLESDLVQRFAALHHFENVVFRSICVRWPRLDREPRVLGGKNPSDTFPLVDPANTLHDHGLDIHLDMEDGVKLLILVEDERALLPEKEVVHRLGGLLGERPVEALFL